MSRSCQSTVYRAGYVLLSLLVLLAVFGIFLRVPGILGDTGASFYHFVVLDASRPFAYRTLLPSAIHFMTQLIPEATRSAILQSARETPAIVDLFNLLEWKLEFTIEFALATTFLFLFLTGFMWAIRYLLNSIFRTEWFLADILPLIAILALPPFFTHTNYLYDPPALFFFTIGLALMIRRNWRWYIAIYILGCLNKETIILLTLVFGIYFYPHERMKRPAYIRLLLSQLGIFTAIRILLMWVYRAAPGATASFTLDYNIRVFTGQTYTLPEVFTWLGIALLVFYQWRKKPLFLRNGVWIIAPLLILMIFFGIVGETRVFYEVYPIVLLLIFHSVCLLWNFEIVDITQPQRDTLSQQRQQSAD